MLSPMQQLWNLWQAIALQEAFLPYYPEILDFDLPENKEAERQEIEAYIEAFNQGQS